MDSDLENGILDPSWVDRKLTATDLTPREIQLRTRWVEEYLFDLDELAATLRCGYPKDLAREYANRFINDPFCNVKIRSELEKSKADTADSSDREELKKKVLIGLVREGHNTGINSSHSARVAALSRLSSILGMEAPKKIEGSITHKGGVMLIPATQQSMDAWEQTAIEGQCKLINEARD